MRKLLEETDDFAGVIENLKQSFDWNRDLKLKRGEIYRIVPERHVAEIDDLSEGEKRNGILSKRAWVPFRKGDPEGNRWLSFDPLYIYWSRENVEWLQTSPEARWQGYHLFFTEGITWTLLGNRVQVKARLHPKCVFDASGSRLAPVAPAVSTRCFLGILNANVASYVIRKFIKNTAAYEIGDLRTLPIVIPTREQHARLEQLAEQAIVVQTEILTRKRSASTNEATNKRIGDLQAELARIEEEVNRVAEEIYGVAGLGPFEEF
jgi:hypothetical protein